MNTQEAIRHRRSVKNYDANFTIPQQDIDLILDLAAQSPSSFNLQHWRVLNITDKALRLEIQQAAWGQVQVTQASHLFLICADVQASEKHPEHYWGNAPKETQDLLIPMLQNFYNGNDALKRDEALRSVGLFSQTLMLAAKSLGYDSCPMIGFDMQKVSELVNLPQDYLIGMMITVGKMAQPAYAKPGYIPLDLLVHENRW